MTSHVQPILVCMSWRGGKRFERALRSIMESRSYFSRVILSITGPSDGDDMAAARRAQALDPTMEVICTGKELPTMKHQDFWVRYLETTGATASDWIYWLAYDDEVRLTGLRAIAPEGAWPIEPRTAYFGPWAMRHETPDRLWDGDPSDELESWTSFPQDGPCELPVATWIADQIRQPTYMQMSGSVNQFSAFLSLHNSHPRKTGPMRIEMAIAAQPNVVQVAEFSEPVSIIYGRSNSDRASYGRSARKEDLHLLTTFAKRLKKNPRDAFTLLIACTYALNPLHAPVNEEWRIRNTLSP